MGLPLRRRRSCDAADCAGTSATAPVSGVSSHPGSADRLQSLKDAYVILSVPLSQIAVPLATASPVAGLIAACLVITVSLVSGIWIVHCDYRSLRHQETRRADAEAEAIRVRAQLNELDAARAEIQRLHVENRRLRTEARQLRADETEARADYRTELHQARLDLRARAERAERQSDRYYRELQRLQAEHGHCKPPPRRLSLGPTGAA